MNNYIRYNKILSKEKTALLIIDIQDRIYRVVQNYDILVENVLKLIKGVKLIDLPIFYTEQYSKGLGPTIPQIKEELRGEAVQKLTFSCFGADHLFEQLKEDKIEQIIVCGIESHVCVLQTVLDLLANDFQVNLAVDAVSSRRITDYNTAVRRMESEGAILTTTEAVLFELLEICGTPLFKEISKLIK